MSACIYYLLFYKLIIKARHEEHGDLDLDNIPGWKTSLINDVKIRNVGSDTKLTEIPVLTIFPLFFSLVFIKWEYFPVFCFIFHVSLIWYDITMMDLSVKRCVKDISIHVNRSSCFHTKTIMSDTICRNDFSDFMFPH